MNAQVQPVPTPIETNRQQKAEALLNELLSLNSLFRSETDVYGTRLFGMTKLLCCGVREYWGINRWSTENFQPKQVLADIVHTFNSGSISGRYGCLLFLEVSSDARCEKLKEYFAQFDLGVFGSTTSFINGNTLLRINQVPFYPNWTVFNNLVKAAPWGFSYTAYAQSISWHRSNGYGHAYNLGVLETESNKAKQALINHIMSKHWNKPNVS